jgi:hypothetical protein
MSKTTCINHPKKETLIIMRTWQVEFCRGNHCAAALLNFYEYWHNIKLAMSEKNVRSNDISEMHGDSRAQDETLLQFHTNEELSEGILNLYGRNAIIQANKLLEELDVIKIQNNPNKRYKFDKTLYYEFNPEVCNDWLNQIYNKTESENNSGNNEIKSSSSENKPRSSEIKQSMFENKRSSFKNKHSSFENKQAITEITSKITNKEKTAAEEIIPQEEKKRLMPEMSAAAFSLLEEDCFIQDRLTDNQIDYLKKSIVDLAAQISIPDKEAMFYTVIETILNPKSFSQAGQDFIHKLNIIKKAIRENKFNDVQVKTVLHQKSLQTEAQTVKASQCKELQSRRNDLYNDCQTLQLLLQAKPDNAYLVNQLKDREIEIEAIEKLIKTQLNGNQGNGDRHVNH